MSKTVETQIINAEERLRQAMLASDVGVLDELLAPRHYHYKSSWRIIRQTRRSSRP